MAQHKKAFAALALALALTAPAFAQSVRILGDHNQWSAYATTESVGRICFALAKPSSVEPRPEGYTEAHFYITHRPSEGVRTEINLVAGYNFAPDTPATLNVGGQSFALYTRGDAAWLANPGEAGAAAQAIRAGSTMTVEGTTERGIKVRQVFSLSGATAASRSIDAACG
jgi:hypothetical protein